jgi:hypothetical protein
MSEGRWLFGLFLVSKGDPVDLLDQVWVKGDEPFDLSCQPRYLLESELGKM